VGVCDGWCVCVCVCCVGVIVIIFGCFCIHLFTLILRYLCVILHTYFSIIHTMIYLSYIHFITSIDCFCSVLRSNLYCLRIFCIFYGTVPYLTPNLLQLTGQFSVLVTTALIFPFPSLGKGSQI